MVCLKANLLTVFIRLLIEMFVFTIKMSVYFDYKTRSLYEK